MNPDKTGKPAMVTISGTVRQIYDGDTFLLYVADQQVNMKIRIYGIDAPEHGQPYNKISRQYLKSLISDQTLIIKYTEMDRYGRIIGRVYLKNGTDVGLELIKAGLAWHYAYFDHTQTYSAAEAKAKKLKKGLWQELSPTAPWDYRRQKRQKNKKKTAN